MLTTSPDMPCGTCNDTSSSPVSFDAVEGLFVERTTLSTAVVGVNGKPYALNQPLVPASHFPRGKWGAFIRVAGIVRKIEAPSAIQVFNEAMRLLQLNNDPFWFVDVWLNLNLQWVPRVPLKHQLVTVQQLEAISSPV